jgi:hypothetical protein
VPGASVRVRGRAACTGPRWPVLADEHLLPAEHRGLARAADQRDPANATALYPPRLPPGEHPVGRAACPEWWTGPRHPADRVNSTWRTCAGTSSPTTASRPPTTSSPATRQLPAHRCVTSPTGTWSPCSTSSSTPATPPARRHRPRRPAPLRELRQNGPHQPAVTALPPDLGLVRGPRS